MAEIETLSVLHDIESLVNDKLQVVSYKWLSRSYLVSSDAAKRLLQEFVDKCESELQVVYALSGWLKNDPSSYHIRLVTGSKLSEAKQDFNDPCSIQVYSVQASIPKDPAALWNAEFVQAEELFKQPFAADNCLRDNRFCGISNSFVKRNLEGMPQSSVAPQSKIAVGAESIKKNTTSENIVSQPQKSEMQKCIPNVGLQVPILAKEVKEEGNVIESIHQASKPPAVKEKVHPLPSNKKKVQSDKTSSSTGCSLANLWGRVPTKPKLSCKPADVENVLPNPSVSSAEAQICAHEASESVNSDDDDQGVNVKRTSNGGSRKRRAVFDFSDDEDFEDVVSLASPENPKGQLCLDLKQNTKLLEEKADLDHDKQLDDRLKNKEEKPRESKQSTVEGKECNSSSAEKNKVCISENDFLPSIAKETKVCAHENDSNDIEKPINAAPASPKRRKVLRTRIDERGREVNEVVWEGEKLEAKRDDVCTIKKSDQSATENTTSNREPVIRKSAVQGRGTAKSTTKAGTKKAGNTAAPKQGNILSFFKRA